MGRELPRQHVLLLTTFVASTGGKMLSVKRRKRNELETQTNSLCLCSLHLRRESSYSLRSYLRTFADVCCEREFTKVRIGLRGDKCRNNFSCLWSLKLPQPSNIKRRLFELSGAKHIFISILAQLCHWYLLYCEKQIFESSTMDPLSW